MVSTVRLADLTFHFILILHPSDRCSTCRQCASTWQYAGLVQPLVRARRAAKHWSNSIFRSSRSPGMAFFTRQLPVTVSPRPQLVGRASQGRCPKATRVARVLAAVKIGDKAPDFSLPDQVGALAVLCGD